MEQIKKPLTLPSVMLIRRMLFSIFFFFFNIYLVITFYLFLGFRMIFAKIVSKRCFVLMANGSALSQTNTKSKEFTRDNIEDVSNPPYADLLEMKDKLEWIS